MTRLQADYLNDALSPLYGADGFHGRPPGRGPHPHYRSQEDDSTLVSISKQARQRLRQELAEPVEPPAVILMREAHAIAGEASAAAKYLPVHHLRTRVPPHSLVVGRHSCMPYYDELAKDLATNGSRLVNSLAQHRYLANFEYYELLRGLTFPTWFEFDEVPYVYRKSPFVVKGRTSARKLQWDTHMFAKDFNEAVRIGTELAHDPLIGPQGLVIRRHLPLETFHQGICGVPVSNEWRLFFYQGTLLAHGFYWGDGEVNSAMEVARTEFELTGIPFAVKVARALKEHVNFFAIDIARLSQGEWRVVDVNDGQQSAINHFISAEELFGNLAHALASEKKRCKA